MILLCWAATFSPEPRLDAALAEPRASADEDALPDTAEVGALYVAPDAAGHGIGRALLTHAVDVRRRGMSRATIWATHR